MGFLSMSQADGSVHLQPLLVNTQATDSIMSPEAILQACSAFASWRQEGFKHDRTGTLQFFDSNENLLFCLPLMKRNGL